MSSAAARSLLDRAGEAAAAYQRDDLVQRLGDARRRLATPAVHVFVVGEYKQGKSSLVNALLGAPVCPVDDDLATAVPTAVRWAEEPCATAVYAAGDSGDDTVSEPVPWEAVAGLATGASASDGRRLRAVEVGFPRQLLAGGLVLVDTPGTGGLRSVQMATTLQALAMADAVLFVSDASQELSAPEIEFLQTARELCPTLVLVLTKIDFYQHWRTIAEVDAAHLAAAGIRAPVRPVSSMLRGRAVADQVATLNDESGFPALLSYLQHEVVAGAERLAIRGAAASAMSAVGHLHAQLDAQYQVLADPTRAGPVAHKLRAGRERAERLRAASARWHVTLNDGIGDITSDVDHDLRARVRVVLEDSDTAIDVGDPAEGWDAFEASLYERVSHEITQNYLVLQRRSSELADLVAEQFEIDRADLVLELDAGDPVRVLSGIRATASLSVRKAGLGTQGMSALRGGYGGMLMFGMLGQMVGLAMLSPVVAGAGLLMGRKSFRDERQRELASRRQQAKNTARKYVDEVSFVVAKDSRDGLRRVHRQLRDSFAAKAEELNRSLAEGLAAAEQAAGTSDADREQRVAILAADLARLREVRQRALVLAPELATSS